MVDIVIGGGRFADEFSRFNLNEFKSSIASDYHRVSHFHLIIPTVPQGFTSSSNFQKFVSTYKNIPFHIEKANIPGVSFATDEVRRYGYGNFERKPYTPVFETVDAIVRSDSEGKNYDFFQSWMSLMIGYDTSGGMQGNTGFSRSDPYEVAYLNDYAIDVSIVAFDTTGNTSLSITLKNAYPIYLGDIDMDWSSTNEVARFPVKLTYSDWYQSRDLSLTATAQTAQSTIPTITIP